MRQREDGCTLAYSKYDGSAYSMPRADFDRLKTLWMGGAAFYEGVSYHGAVLVLKLGDIVAISDVSPEAMTARLLDDRASAAEDALES